MTISNPLDQAIRDICDVSVAPAAKSKVREILVAYSDALMKQVVPEKGVGHDNMDGSEPKHYFAWNACRAAMLANYKEIKNESV